MLKEKLLSEESADKIYGLRVLVVEDYRDSANAEAALLRLFGHKVEVAVSLRDAIEVALDYVPDVVLLDIDLPASKGLDLVKRLVKKRQGKLPLAVLITEERQGDRQRSTNAGIDLHLLKPIDHNKLIATLRDFQKSLSVNAQR